MLILLLLAVPAVLPLVPHPSHIAELVRIACRAIRLTREPSTVTMLARYHRAEAVDMLQRVLSAHFDADGDGRLNDPESAAAVAAGVEPSQLEASVIAADLDSLVATARSTGLLAPSVTATEIRVAAWDTARAETERTFGPKWNAIHAYIDKTYELPDYTKWETWKRGMTRFPGYVVWPLTYVAPLRTLLAWLGLCALASVVVASTAGRLPRLLTLLGAAIVGLAMAGIAEAVHAHEAASWPLPHALDLEACMQALALICFTCVAADLGRKLATVVRPGFPRLPAALVTAGAILLAWGFSVRRPNPLLPGWADVRGWGEFFFHLQVEPWMQAVALALGCSSIVAGAWQFVRYMEQSRERPQLPEHPGEP